MDGHVGAHGAHNALNTLRTETENKKRKNRQERNCDGEQTEVDGVGCEKSMHVLRTYIYTFMYLRLF